MKHLLFAVSLALPLPALAQTMDHTGHTMSGDQSPASMALAAANTKMHADMNMSLTGNPDVDFVQGMIPHHQGAVDMARIVLEYGTDPEVRAFAEGVIDAQEAEIAWMTDWLAKNKK
ncbi:CopM family metallochaperone [Pseudorhodobacter ferrugineus]|uniref:CopM family metallochaperone n=1 Tax=Pseudorhodobacter ferrugineus TaxID=77008 RepID=UPI0003B69B03|nr:DUF305 domain-containing protein [Pseudorhodobacter ferrugineus]